MDYFYAGTGSPAGGLSNPFLRIKYTSNNKLFTFGLDYHYFAFANAQKDETGKKLDNYLGSEFDFLAGYSLNKITNLELGLSYLVATTSMEYAKNIPPGSAQKNASWAYLQVNVKPEFLFQIILSIKHSYMPLIQNKKQNFLVIVAIGLYACYFFTSCGDAPDPSVSSADSVNSKQLIRLRIYSAY